MESLQNKRIFLLTSALNGGGAERVFCWLALQLERHGARVTVFSLSGNPPPESSLQDVHILGWRSERDYPAIIWKLSREIRRRTGKTYKELLQEKRMQQAVYMLTNSAVPVTDIIESVGYDNTSYFYRIFREKYGMSPKEYRRKL